jgi:hypothetical protein
MRLLQQLQQLRQTPLVIRRPQGDHHRITRSSSNNPALLVIDTYTSFTPFDRQNSFNAPTLPSFSSTAPVFHTQSPRTRASAPGQPIAAKHNITNIRHASFIARKS